MKIRPPETKQNYFHNLTDTSSVQSNNTKRQLKDYQYIDQSLRTVATQLLNVTNPEEPTKTTDSNNKVIKKSSVSLKPIERNDVSAVKELTVNNGQMVNVGIGRPMNSKFSYFEVSHPGQAMAMTEEELEKEMSSTRLMTAYKNQPTTTGGISTWILLNPPSTTIKAMEVEKKTNQSSETEAKLTLKPTTLMERVETTERVVEKITVPVSTTVRVEETPSTRRTVLMTTKKTPGPKPEKVETLEKLEPVQSTTPKLAQLTSTTEGKESSVATTKKVQPLRTTPKPKIATIKTTVLSKPSIVKTPRPNQPSRPKLPPRRTTVKPDIPKNDNNSTAKIEKVTFKPIQMITATKSKTESTEKPMFVTKIKASILMDTQKTTTQPTISTTASLESATLKFTPGGDITEASVKAKPSSTKVNNVLKVQLKKPLDETTKIEIGPIKVSTPVVKIEKVEVEDVKDEENKDKDSLDDSKIDLKFDFNPELTKINVDSDASTSTSVSSSTSTTKRPRHISKRKKNKSRRRKPTTSTTTTTTTVAPEMSVSTELQLPTENLNSANDLQESKIEPETKVTVNATKTKRKPSQKPISTQIYNFLSREVMPSFGMMSLVGLGLGLASYFLYPFGGTISRRNYEVEPKYKYNFEEYGGNYGQNEEEVLSKVLQGMTADESNYQGSKDYNNNYYQYQHFDGSRESHTTKRNDQRYSSSPVYTVSGSKYGNTDYRYPDAPITPNYYDRIKHPDYVVGQTAPGSANRQFVVGSVPKDYPPYEEKVPALSTPGKLPTSYESTESEQVLFNHDVGPKYNYLGNFAQNYDQPNTARPDEGYEEVEINPTAVAVEHGPRSLKRKRSVLDSVVSFLGHPRRKRDSVIQVIPSKRELEEEEKEENLSNEILNIIDSALPGEDTERVTKKKVKDNEVEDFEADRRKQKEEEKIRLKESTTRNVMTETSTVSTTAAPPQESTSSATKEVTDSSAFPTTVQVDSEGNTTQSTEWTDSTTEKSPEQNGFNLFNFVKKVAEIKFRLGLTLLKHASEGFARYLGHVQKRINGDE